LRFLNVLNKFKGFYH